MAEQIGFLGPGMMGRGIVKNLLKKGYPVTVFAHRDGLNLEELTQAGIALRFTVGGVVSMSIVRFTTVVFPAASVAVT